MADKAVRYLIRLLGNIKNLYDEKYDKGSFYSRTSFLDNYAERHLLNQKSAFYKRRHAAVLINFPQANRAYIS